MKRLFYIFLFTALANVGAFAQADDIEGCRNVSTIAGKLSVLDVKGMREDGLYNEVELNGMIFDKLYGFTGSCIKHFQKNGLVDRMLMYDFSNGGNSPPSIYLYDFTENPAVSIAIADGDPLLLSDVKWTDSDVLLKLNGEKYFGWYKFDGEKLRKIRGAK